MISGNCGIFLHFILYLWLNFPPSYMMLLEYYFDRCCFLIWHTNNYAPLWCGIENFMLQGQWSFRLILGYLDRYSVSFPPFRQLSFALLEGNIGFYSVVLCLPWEEDCNLWPVIFFSLFSHVSFCIFSFSCRFRLLSIGSFFREFKLSHSLS